MRIPNLARGLAAALLTLPVHLSLAPHSVGADQGSSKAATQAALETHSCYAIEGQESLIVTTRNGLLRRIDLGSLKAVAEAREHEGADRWISVKQVEGERIVTLDFAGRGFLRSS